MSGRFAVGRRVFVVQQHFPAPDLGDVPLAPTYCWGKVVSYDARNTYPYTVAVEGIDPGKPGGRRGTPQGNLFTYAEDELA